jgi:superfamily II DNA or RNA helicase
VRVLGGVVAVPRALLSAEEVAADWEALSCPNPAQVAAERRGDRQAHLTPRVSTLAIGSEDVLYPIAAASVYRQRLFAKHYQLVDERPRHEAHPLAYGGALLPYQERAVAALASKPCGVVVGPCGCGKGEMIVATVGRLGLPTLVLVAQVEQATELVARVEARLGVKAGLVGAGEQRVERITVALVQSLDEAHLEQLRDRFEVVIVDEAHHAAADSYRAVLCGLRARRWYGFTATIDREDGLRPFVHHFLGPVVYEVTRAELEAAGRSLTPRLEQVRTRFRFPYASQDDWHALLEALEIDVGRNELIAGVVVREAGGELCAVLTGRVEHAKILAAMLEARGLRVALLHGAVAKKARARLLEVARGGGVDVVVGTQLLDEGIDVPRLARVFLTWPGRAEGRLVQRIGRALRPHAEKGEPVIFDFIDDAGPLRWQAQKRAAAFARTWPSAERRAAA